MVIYEIKQYLYPKYFFILKIYFTFTVNYKNMGQITVTRKDRLHKTIFLRSGVIIKIFEYADGKYQWFKMDNKNYFESIDQFELFNILTKDQTFVNDLIKDIEIRVTQEVKNIYIDEI